MGVLKTSKSKSSYHKLGLWSSLNIRKEPSSFIYPICLCRAKNKGHNQDSV